LADFSNFGKLMGELTSSNNIFDVVDVDSGTDVDMIDGSSTDFSKRESLEDLLFLLFLDASKGVAEAKLGGELFN